MGSAYGVPVGRIGQKSDQLGYAIKTLPLFAAKAKLSSLVERVSAHGEKFMITRNGRAAAILVSPGEFYGEAASNYVRVAVVQSDAQLELVARRLGVS